MRGKFPLAPHVKGNMNRVESPSVTFGPYKLKSTDQKS